MFVQSWLCQQIKTYNEFFEQAEKPLAQHAQSHLHAKLRADFQNQKPPLRTSTSSQLQMQDFFGFPQYLSCDDIESKRFAIFTDSVRKHWRSVRDDETRKAKGKFEEQRRQAKRGNRLKRVSIRTYWNLDQTFNRME